MHPRHIYYKRAPDFGKLGEKCPEFRPYLIATKSGDWTINFKDPEAFRELTIALLKHDFGLDIKLPLDRLIPAIPQRLNYIHWVEDLLNMLPLKEHQLTGIDIGTGASCVFPLLGAKINNWKFHASEIDEVSFRFACDNVKRNSMENQIQLHLVNSDHLLGPFFKNQESYDFCMCNPPFFSDFSEASGGNSRSGSRPKPSSICTGTGNEVVTSGGEVDFIGRMIDASLELKTRVLWYTSMLGKKTSLATVVSKLKHKEIQKIFTTEFCQGRTRRWGVAWTFSPHVSIQEPRRKQKKCKPLQFSFSPKNEGEDYGEIKDLVLGVSQGFRGMLGDLNINILEEDTESSGDVLGTKFQCRATEITWANQRQKRREAMRKLGKEHEDEVDCEPSAKRPRLTSQESSEKSENATIIVAKIPQNTECVTPNQVLNNTETSVLSNTDYFIDFTLEIGVKRSEIKPKTLPCFSLKMNWIDGKNRNSFYQLFQYFQNKLT